MDGAPGIPKNNNKPDFLIMSHTWIPLLQCLYKFFKKDSLVFFIFFRAFFHKHYFKYILNGLISTINMTYPLNPKFKFLSFLMIRTINFDSESFYKLSYFKN